MSDVPEGPERIGAELRAAREALGWELPAVAGMLRIRLPYLEALEDGRVAELPGAAYAVGFLRTYAASLGLDADEMSRRFRAGSGTAVRRTELAFPAPVPQRGIPAGAVVLLGLLLAGGAYVGWYRYSGDQHTPVQTVPAIPDRLATAASPASTPSPQVASILPSTAPPSPLPPPAAAAQGSAAPAGTPAPASPAGAPAATTPAASTVAPAPPAAGTPAAVDADQVSLHATAASWVMVRPPHGPALLNKVLHAGEDWTVPTGQKLALSTGNAAGLQLVVGGTPVAPLAGTARRDVPLDAALLRAGKVQAAPPAPKPRAAPKPATAAPEDSADALNARQLTSTPH